MTKFEKYLRNKNLSENTINVYAFTISMFLRRHKTVTKENLLEFKGYLIENYKPKTVNLRIQGINKYLDFIGKSDLRISAVKIQQKSFLENVISDADYNFFKKSLKKDGNLDWYFVIRFLAATGARVSELIKDFFNTSR